LDIGGWIGEAAVVWLCKRVFMVHFLRQFFGWLVTWLRYVLVICLIGAVLGVLSHLLFGLCFMDSPDYGYLAAFGLMNGLTYGGVWAGGAAIVLCVMRARRLYLAKHPEEGALG
jgi:hypothetical protein